MNNISAYTISDHNLHICDSYKVKKKDFVQTLDAIELRDPNYAVWNRSKSQMALEWATHNACWHLGLWKDRAASCDLNYPQPWYIRWAYAIIGCLVWIFIP